MVQAVTCRPLTEETRFQSQTNSCRKLCRNNGTGTGFSPTASREEMVRKEVKNYRGPSVWKGPRPCCIFFCLSQYYHSLPTAQINPFRPRPNHSATQNQSFRFSVKIFRRSTLARGPKSFSPGPETAFGGRAEYFYVPLQYNSTSAPHSFTLPLNSTTESVVK